jgi:dihydrofolate reductase
MKGGTVFHFVTDGIEAALERAREAAGDQDIRIGGGAATVRQYLAARLIDELHLAWRPMLMGAGERIFEGLDAKALGYECEKSISGERATHVFLRKKP